MPKRRFNLDENTPFYWQVILQLWPYMLEYKIRVIFALLCLVAAKGASVLLPFLLKYIVDDLNQDSSQTALIAAPASLIVGYGCIRLFNTLIGEVRDTLFGRVTERAMRRIGLKVFNHLHKLELAFHLDRQTGGLSRDIERGSSGISFLMRFMVFNIGPTLLEIIMVTGLLFYYYGFTFALIILLSVIAYVSYSIKATNWRTRFVKEMNNADNRTHTRAIDSLINFETVKYFSNEQHEAQCYDKSLASWENARRKNRLSVFALNGGQAFIIALSMTSMMLVAANGVVNGTMTIGDFVLINAFTMQLFLPLNFLGFVYREIKGSLANIENLFSLLQRPLAIKDNPNAPDICVSSGKVNFNNVSFQYNEERKILKHISFTVNAGEKVAIVGESGSGKSSLMKCLFRFYDIQTGSIEIDHQDISQVTQDSLRKSLGIVPQDTVLFNDTLEENIRYGKPGASNQELQRVIELAYLSDFISKLPQGLQTRVGERGLKLSGGEKQRVAIARALLKNPPILVFDEATSSLDSGSEQAILAALRNAAEGHTSIVIAHRLSTIVDADNIIVLDKGSVAEQGSHNELLKQGGIYTQLWQAQN
ncbi:ABC transporter ATP-binding protein/permease [Alteromonas sp. 5E99-2]|uniref:ABCB family ABC transporter ATP-binding protein/permease n=1 Tax=Alteromonas sp. 5E99-2 TaxID=2817683 RepID=UPI001A99D34B|nr:ABC transporter ATP-binding protein/permease [Alteromonas sp. 5E99-2]MBO1256193.1 ABC transporter ATP-binding protein/permease [Alteromonas sp. 5E99-2]